MIHARTVPLALGLAVASAACSKPTHEPAAEPVTTTAPRASPAAQPEAEPPLAEVAEHMKAHFLQVRALKDAVIAGDYAATRDPATWLAEHGAPSEVPDSWIEHVTDLKVVAAGARDATDLAGVAEAVGALGRSCANCHVDLKAVPKLAIPPAPLYGDRPDEVMRRHAWAAERMWEGLFGPSEKSWQAGASLLAQPGLFPAELNDIGAGAPELVRLEARVREIGKEAVSETDSVARGTLYGRLLATCASCHRAVPGAPPKQPKP